MRVTRIAGWSGWEKFPRAISFSRKAEDARVLG
jgi:hypothetical protein